MALVGGSAKCVTTVLLFFTHRRGGLNRVAFGDGLGKVLLVNNVVAVEHASSTPARQFHYLAFTHASPTHVSRESSPQVVQELASETRLTTGNLPSPAYALLSERFPAIVEHV